MWGFIKKQKYSKESLQENKSVRRMPRQKTTPLKRAGQSIVASNKRKKEVHEDTPYPNKTKISRLEVLHDNDEEVPELLDEEEERGGGGEEEEESNTTMEEDEFWDKDKQTKTQWAAEARRYKLPICTKTLRLSCPAKECIEKKNDMTPVYIECKSRQGGTYVAMMYSCNYCNAFAPTREDAQKNNVFAGHIVAKFVQNYIRRAKDCGIDDISTIPLPEHAFTTTYMGRILNTASANLPTVTDIMEELRLKLREVHAIIVKEFKKKEEEVEEEIPCSQAQPEEE